MDDKKMRREKLVQVLERGKESAAQMRRLLDDDDDDDDNYGQIDAHSLEVLASFSTALSMLLLFDDYDHLGLKRPNPTRPPHHPHFKSEEFEDRLPKNPKDGRGCYKRRKAEQSVEIEAPNTDDGYAWRKYGQKAIQHTKHPRNYYRCTHKTDQGCQATKQVQQTSENPPKFNIIYHGHHTCKDPLKTPLSYLDLIDDHNQDSSSFFLSFEASKTPKQGLNPLMFPSSSSSTSSTSSSSGYSMSNAIMVEQEYKPIEDANPSVPSDHHHGPNIQCPSSSDFLSTTSDLTTTTLVSDDVISLAEVYSSEVSPHGVEEDYSYIMAESIDFNEVFQDYLLCA